MDDPGSSTKSSQVHRFNGVPLIHYALGASIPYSQTFPGDWLTPELGQVCLLTLTRHLHLHWCADGCLVFEKGVPSAIMCRIRV